MRLWGTALIAVALGGCSFDWDRYDPSLGGGPSGGDGGGAGAGGAAPCDDDDGFVDPATSRCYLYLPGFDGTWDQARDRCASRGAGFDLAAVSSQAEHAFLIAEPEFEEDMRDGDQVWLGGTDADDEGTWVWTNGEPFLDVWVDMEPNDGGVDGEDCIAYRIRDGFIGYDDKPCDADYAALCERAD